MPSRFDLIVKGGTVLTASGSKRADVGVSKGVVAAIRPGLESPGAEFADAHGKVVFPGGVDVHTHLDMPLGKTSTADDFATGTRAAVCGGTTTIIDYAAQTPGRPLMEGLETWHRKAEGKSVCDYGFHMTLAEPPRRMGDLDRMVREGVPTFKLFMAYPGRFMLGDEDIFRVMRHTRSIGAMSLLHAENGVVIEELIAQAKARGMRTPLWHALTRPIEAEAEAVNRAVALAGMAKAGLYVVHVTSGQAMDAVRRGRARGVRVFGETCPQYLYLTIDKLMRRGYEAAKYVMAPPLRSKDNPERLWEGLRKGWLQTVGTDHCSFDFRGTPKKPGKELGKKDFARIPGGVPGIEYRVPLLWDAVQRGRLTKKRFVEVCCTEPARIFGLWPRKGDLRPGSDADIVILDPAKSRTLSARTHRMNVDYCPYEGMRLRGAVEDVYVRGRLAAAGGSPVLRPPSGRFLKRALRR